MGVLIFAIYPLKKLISELGGKINYQGIGVFPFQGRDIFIKYIPGSRNRRPELRIYTQGYFGAEVLIRYENIFDRFYKQIGLNRELQVPDAELGDKLYFECDDQDFLNFFFLNPQTKSSILELLKSYSDIEVTKGRCLLKRYPAPALSMISKDDILRSAQELLAFSPLIPISSGNHPELVAFKVKRALLYSLGSLVLAAGVISWLWATAAYRVVDAGHLWMMSFNYSGVIAIIAGGLAFLIIRGFSTSSKAFIFFLLTFGIGGLLCGRYGLAVYNGSYDQSPIQAFDQLIVNKYTTTSKGNTTYHVVVQPWRSAMGYWESTVPSATYTSIYPGSTLYRIQTRSGRLGFEWVVYQNVKAYEERDFSFERSLPSTVNGIDFADNALDIPINPMLNLNGMSRDHVLSLRQDYVEKIPSLAPADYQPSKEIFGQIQDGRPWWGMLGICYYGTGERSIEGPSRESQYIANPYLLIGVESPLAYIVNNPSLEPEVIYPVPKQLTWDQGGAWGRVIYNVHDYYNGSVRYNYTDIQDLYLRDYNARDRGFNYFAIDSALSTNIIGATDKVIPIIQFIHKGGSCGYPGGCNNMSPHQPDLQIRWRDLPARIYIKLWKGKVKDPSQRSDMDFIVDLN